MNKIYLGMLLLLILVPTALALETSIIKTEIDVTWNDATKLFTINGENLDWSRTLNTTDFTTTLEILMARDLGNYSEVTNLMEVCEMNMNFSYKWEVCTEKLLEEHLKTFSMVNETDYDACIVNLTTCKSDKELEIVTLTNSKDKSYEDLQDDLDKEKQNKSYITMALVGVGAYALWLSKKYRVWEKKASFTGRDDKSEKKVSF